MTPTARCVTVAAAGAVLAAIGGAVIAAPGLSVPVAFVDGFDRGLCVGPCPGARWAIRQEEDGRVDALPAPGRAGRAMRATAAARRGRVTKAAIVARTAPLRTGTAISVAFDLYAPPGTPLDSIQLVDIECATCGEGGNPGIRLYLRRGRLRIDRSKIGIEHAWTNDAAPQLATGRWHRIAMAVRIAADESGTAQVTLDGRRVIAARGATILPGADHADRIQIGVTANSNAVPVTLWFDDVAVSAR